MVFISLKTTTRCVDLLQFLNKSTLRMPMINPRRENVRTLIDSSALLTVPPYQRAYEWGNNEVGEFWDDLAGYSSGEDNFFLGTLIFNVNQKNNEILIVDGQQRITTIFIFLIACRLRLDAIGSNQAITIARYINQLISSINPSTGETTGYRLNASTSIKDVFEGICNGSWDGSHFPEKIGKKGVKQQVRKVKPIYDFFSEKLSELDQPEISKLLSVLYDAYFVRIDINSDEEAFKIFERNNARGVDLEASDLLKNYLFQNLGSDISDVWDKIIDNAGGSFPRMLKYFYVSRKGYIRKSDLYRELKKFEPNQLLIELQEFSDFFTALRSNDDQALKQYLLETGTEKGFDNSLNLVSDQDKINRINISMDGLRFFKITQIYPLIFSAIHCFNRSPIPESSGGNSKLQNQLVTFFQNLEAYHFINNAICARIGNEIEKLYANFSKEFSESTDFIGTSKKLFGELKTRLAVEEEFTARFVEINYEQTGAIPLLMYIFDRFYNYDFNRNQTVSSSSLSRLKIFNPSESYSRRSLNVDHWYPQNSRAETSLTKEDIHNIGNLIVISFKANSSLNNDLPELKIQKLKDQGSLSGEIQGSNYVKNFINEYGEFSSNWTTEIIRKRALDLSKAAYQKVWKFREN
jgi:uncharacterized protein with ParB-like and HNH nuclease domain